MDFYLVKEDAFSEVRPNMKWRVVPDYEELQLLFAKELGERIQMDQKAGRLTKIVLPVGPIRYETFSQYCNDQSISCENLVIIPMDAFCDKDGQLVPEDHPFCLRSYIRQSIVDALKPELAIPPHHVLEHNPDAPAAINERIRELGGIDIVYGGIGINGHWAMNDPVEPGESISVEEMKNWSTRAVTLNRETMTQLVMGGSDGNWDLIPPKGITLGFKELLSADEVHLYFMRKWHAGVFRRALLGPITTDFPASLIQTHPNVTVSLSALAAHLPSAEIRQSNGA